MATVTFKPYFRDAGIDVRISDKTYFVTRGVKSFRNTLRDAGVTATGKRLPMIEGGFGWMFNIADYDDRNLVGLLLQQRRGPSLEQVFSNAY